MKAFALNQSKAVIAAANQTVTFTACGSFFHLSGPHELQAAKEAIEYALNYGEQPISTSGPVQHPPSNP